MRLVLISFGMMISALSMGQRSFTLEEAMKYGAKNSYETKLSKMDLEIAKKKVKETIAIGLPQISGKGSYQNFLEQPVQLVPAEFFGGQAGEFAEVIFGTKQNVSGELSASQLIFDGSYIVGLQATRAYTNFSEVQLSQTKLNAKEKIAEAYTLVLAAQENLRILNDNVGSMEQMYSETQAMYESGFAAEEDVDQLAISLSRIKASIRNAEYQVQSAKSLLKFHMGIPVDLEIILTDQVETLVGQNADLTGLSTDMDLSRNVNIALARSNKDLQRLAYKNAKAAYLPRLAAFASYQQNSFANKFNFLESQALWFPTLLVGVNLEIPIFSSGMRHHQVGQAKVEYNKAKVMETQAKEGARLEFETASRDYLNAMEVFDLEKRNLALSEKIKETTSIKFKEGLSTSFELVQSENQLAQTQGAYIQALISVLNAKTKLNKSLNRL